MKDIVKILKEGGVAVVPTDTLYGLVALALDEQAVEKVYKIKKRTPTKPFIILLASINDLKTFGIEPNTETLHILEKVWPGKVSVTLALPGDLAVRNKFTYLHRGINTLAFRVPDKKNLHELLIQTGPLIAPSANPEGKNPAETIEQAKEYFGDSINEYVDEGVLAGEHSTLIEIENGKFDVLRHGAGDVKL